MSAGARAVLLMCGPMGNARAHDGVELAFDAHAGNAAAPFTVVLVHGWAGNRSYWDVEVDRLVKSYPVVTLDLGGHGESGLGRDDWTLPAFGDDVVTVVEASGAGPVVLVGHSMGGDAVVYAAERLGDQVRGIVWVDAFRSLGDEPVSPPDVVDAFVQPFRDDFDNSVRAFARGLFHEQADPVLVDRVAADMAAASTVMALGSLGYALNRHPPLLKAMETITAPFVAINPAASTDTESLLRFGVGPIEVEGVGHFVMLEEPDQFHELLASALASFEP
jgi:pimeloyl-ACP methyl ester carboxylesterase